MTIDGFQDSLYDLVEGVWGDLIDDPCAVSTRTIYRRYSGSGRPPPTDWEVLDGFLAGLLAMPSLAAGRTPVLRTGVQDTDNPETNDWYTFADYRAFLQPDDEDAEREDAWSNFYHVHYPLDDGGADTTRRVYVGVTSVAHNGIVVLSPVLDVVASHPTELFGAKIVAPGGQPRRDHIVVYARTAVGQRRSVDCLRAMDQRLFADGLPPCIEPVLPGIGIADEPPADLDDPRDPDRDGHPRLLDSHGRLMAAIIWRIARGYRAHWCRDASRRERDRILADETAHELNACIRDGNTPARYHFLADVRNEFRRWRVDPLTPHLTHDSAQPPERRFGTGRAPSGVEAALRPALAAATAATGVAANAEPARTGPYRRAYVVRPATRRDREADRGRKLLKLQG